MLLLTMNSSVIVQLGKHSKCLCMSDDGKIMTNFGLRREVHHLDRLEIFPGDIISS